MVITPNHAIVPSHDFIETAGFYASILLSALFLLHLQGKGIAHGKGVVIRGNIQSAKVLGTRYIKSLVCFRPLESCDM